jgi:hypothetical protein
LAKRIFGQHGKSRHLNFLLLFYFYLFIFFLGYQNGRLFSLSFNSKVVEGYPIDTSANQLLLAMLRQDIGQCPFFLFSTSNGGLVVNRIIIDSKSLSESNFELEIVPKAKLFLNHVQGIFQK